MNKADLVEKIASSAELSKADATKALDATLGAIQEGMVAGDKITLPGFGTFSVGERAARTGRNPKTGEEISIAAKKTVKFKAGKALSDGVNA